MMFSIFQTLRESMAIDSYSRGMLLNYQKQEFTRLVNYTYKNSPYYRKIIVENNIDLKNPRLEDFPILTKKILKENFNDIVTDRRIKLENISRFCENIDNDEELFLNKYHITKSSGTSGDSPYIIQTPKEMLRGVSPGYRGRKFSLKRKKIAYVGDVTYFSASKITMGFFRKSLISKILYNYKFIPLKKNTTEWLSELNNFKPDVLCGYGKALVFFAELKQSNQLKFEVQELGCGAELLFSFEKKFVESIFNAPVYNQYASTEHIVMGMCSAGQSGFVLSEDRLIFEMGTTDTKITNLYNYTLPLIRYQTNDILIPVQDTFLKQWPYQIISEHIGRSDEIFIENSVNQRNFHPHHINQHLLKENLSRFIKSIQLNVKKQTEITFYIELLNEKMIDSNKNAISISIKQYFKSNGSNFEIINIVFKKIEKMDKPNGKTSFFVD